MGQFPNDYTAKLATDLTGAEEFLVDVDGTHYITINEMKKYLNLLEVVDYAGDRTLVLSDAGKKLRQTGSTPNTLSIPLNADVPFPIGTVIIIRAQGTGMPTIAGETGVTITGDTFVFDSQYQEGYMHQVSADVWDVKLGGSAGADVTAPGLVGAAVEDAHHDRIVLIYDEALNESIVPSGSDFTPSGGRTVSSVAVVGTVVTLTVDTPYTSADTITISYNGGAATNPLQDAAGNEAADLTTEPVDNNIASSPEAETTAFVSYVEGTLGETVSPTEETALNDWFVTMKTGTNPLSKALAAYHVLGGSVARKINSVNPDNTDAAKRIVTQVGCVVDGTGIETDGVDDYFTNNIIDGTDTPLADFAIAFHNSISRAGADSKFAFGTVSGSGATYANLKNAAGNMNEGRIQQSGDSNFGANADTAGHYIFNHRIETPGTLNRRTVDVGATLLFDSPYDPSVQTPVSSGAQFAFGAFWSDGAGSALLFDNVKFGILVIFNEGLSDAEKTIVRNANTDFITAMGR